MHDKCWNDRKAKVQALNNQVQISKVNKWMLLHLPERNFDLKRFNQITFLKKAREEISKSDILEFQCMHD